MDLVSILENKLMLSPFPGMNPYLEQPIFWSSFHVRLIGAIAAAIEPQLSRQYYVEIETRTYQSDDADDELLIGIPDAAVVACLPTESPAAGESGEGAMATTTRPIEVTLAMPMTLKERYLEVREVGTDAVVAVIEVLSPKHKRAGKGRDAYEKKRRAVLGSATHLIELDLLRGGKAMPILGKSSRSAYRILVSRSDRRPAADLYAISLQQPLPTVPIPLKPGDADVAVDLQAVLIRVYEEARYTMRIDYGQPTPPPALTEAEQNWVQALLTER